MTELLYCEITGCLIGYRSKSKTVIFEWVDGKRVS